MASQVRWALALLLAASLLAALVPGRAQAVAEGRAWELVTFGEPSSSLVFAMNPMGENGDAILYQTIGPPPGAASGAFFSGSLAVRGESGWQSSHLAFPYEVFDPAELAETLVPVVATAYAADPRTSLWLASVPLTADGPPDGELAFYRRTADGSLDLVAALGEGTTFEYEGFADISDDGERVVFASDEHLLPEDAGRVAGESIYEWDGTGLHLVDVTNLGTLLSSCGSSVSSAGGMSQRGDRVFFANPAEGGCGGTRRVFLRDLDAGTTVEVSASRCTRIDCGAPQDVDFAGATPDGGAAFLTTAQQLTDDDLDLGRDLYRYDVGSDELTLLSGGSPTATGAVAQAAVYPSPEGARVYFRASGEVLPGEVGEEEKLFLADQEGARPVAAASFPAEPEIQVAAGGARALLVTTSALETGDTDTRSDVYLYEATGETLTRVSAGPAGGNGEFDATISSPFAFAGLKTGNDEIFRAIDSSGERAFFSTPEDLVPGDAGGKTDVYEWKGGQLDLVSPASAELSARFGGVSGDGRTVVIGTNATLVGADRDGGDGDLYAVRLGGGFPEPEPSACGPACSVPEPARLQRAAPRSETRGRRLANRIRVLEVRAADGRHLLGRDTVVVVSVPVVGRVFASVRGRAAGKARVLARGAARAREPGRVEIALRLTAAGRRGSAPRGSLTVKSGKLKTTVPVRVGLGTR
jgi:hypothetical protein